MGGLMFILAIAVAVFTAGWPDLMAGNRNHLYVFLFALVFGIIGFIDDFQKLRHHANEGLTAPRSSCSSWRRPSCSRCCCATAAI